MKKLFLFAMVAAALSGCSNSDEVDTNPEVQPGGEGYVGFSIQLPTTSSSATRANDVFDDGDVKPDEYKVHNATMFIFKGPNEADATFVDVYEMNVNAFNTDGTTTDQCTTEGTVSSKITKPETSGANIYAYVMINHNGLINVPGKTINGNNLTTTTKFSEFSKLQLPEIGDLTHGMVMTNAPVASKAGGASAPAAGATVTTLTRLEPSKIHATQAAAEADPAGEVYMERAAVKVTVEKGSLSGSIPGGVTYSTASIKWALSNVNTKYYNTRQMKDTWLGYHAQGDGTPLNANIEGTVNSATKYRFVSGSAIHDAVYRTYWGEDVNYNDNTGLTGAPSLVNKDLNTSEYTFENTFDVEHQVTKNTTGIAVSATFNDGNSFYTASTYGDNKILQEPTSSVSGEKIQDYIMTYLCNNYSQFKTWYDKIGGKNRITVDMDNTTATHATVTGVTLATGADPLPSEFGQSQILAALNSITFKYYENGVAYYNVLIKHFGDSETPWNRENHTENNINGVYQSIKGTPLSENLRDNNYLGRYGIVRNNWYQIKITGIRQIGSPVIVDPSGNDNPDDNVDNYLSVRIHITPWAVRKQEVEL